MSDNLTSGSKPGRVNPPRLLTRMREVCEQSVEDDGPDHLGVRAWLEADPAGFRKEVRRMEKELSARKERKESLRSESGVAVPDGDVAAAGGADAAGVAPKFDPKTEWLLALIARCRSRLEEKEKGGVANGGAGVQELRDSPSDAAPAAVCGVLRRPGDAGEVPGGARRADG